MTARGPVHVAVRPTPALALTPAPAGLLRRKCACGGAPGLAGECAECREKRLTLQRRAVHQSAPSEVPAIVHEVLRSPGRPLDPAARAFHGSRFGHDFSRVRVHTDGRAARSARAVGSLAYTVGEQIVFGAGQYDPSGAAGRALLAHELAHVVQGAGGSGLPRGVAPADSPWEREADRAAAVVSGGPRARLVAGAPPLIRRKIDPGVRAWLDFVDSVKERAKQDNWSDTVIAANLITAAANVGLSDPDNLRMFVDRVRANFYDRPEVLVGILTWVEDHFPTPVDLPPPRQFPGVVQRRGPYGVVGPGVAIPVIAGALRPLAELIEAILYAFQSAGAFLAGIGDGMGTLSEDKAKEFATRVLGSMALSLAFTPVFLAGAAVGVGQDVVGMVKGIVELVGNWREMLSAVWELVKTMFTSQGPRLARAIGFEIGKGFADKIIELLQYNRIRFAYELGRWIGPTLVYIVLSFLGVPEMAYARFAEALGGYLENFPRIMALANKVRKVIPGSEARKAARAEARVIKAEAKRAAEVESKKAAELEARKAAEAAKAKAEAEAKKAAEAAKAKAEAEAKKAAETKAGAGAELAATTKPTRIKLDEAGHLLSCSNPCPLLGNRYQGFLDQPNHSGFKERLGNLEKRAAESKQMPMRERVGVESQIENDGRKLEADILQQMKDEFRAGQKEPKPRLPYMGERSELVTEAEEFAAKHRDEMLEKLLTIQGTHRDTFFKDVVLPNIKKQMPPNSTFGTRDYSALEKVLGIEKLPWRHGTGPDLILVKGKRVAGLDLTRTKSLAHEEEKIAQLKQLQELLGKGWKVEFEGDFYHSGGITTDKVVGQIDKVLEKYGMKSAAK
jgi:hypothetical protein